MKNITTEQQLEIFRTALIKAGKYCRDNLPAAFPEDPAFFNIIAGGNARDPKGNEFINYFLSEACQELEIEGV